MEVLTMNDYRSPQNGLVERMYDMIVAVIGKTRVSMDYFSLRNGVPVPGELVMPLEVAKEFGGRGRKATLPYSVRKGEGIEYLI